MGQAWHQCRKSSHDQEGLGLGTDTVLGQVLGTHAPAEMEFLGDEQGRWGLLVPSGPEKLCEGYSF